MIYEITSDWTEINGKWIRAESKEEAKEYLSEKNCEYTFSLEEVEGVPCGRIDFNTI